ncbi:MAG: SDR family NAD(P)-dependent oxidoreductase [Pseudomonadota bacterium]
MSDLSSFPQDFTAVVVGSTGGLGSAFAEQLKRDPRCGRVLEFSRSSDPSLDLEDEASIERVCASIDGEVHLIIDATGVLHDQEMQPEKAISSVDPEQIARAFAVNASGPLLLLKHFHRLLPRKGRSVFASVSARVGSIADNRLGGWYGYRASKAALNMFLQTAAIEVARRRPEAICLALHPGTVKTPLSEPFAGDRDRFEPAQSAEMLLQVIGNAQPTGTASFLAYDGSEIPW